MKYLKGQISPFHSQIRADVLVDGPRKFVVQFPSHKRHEHRSQGDHTRYGHEKRPRFDPYIVTGGAYRRDLEDGFLYLIQLHGTIDQKSQVIDTEANHLNGVLES